MDLAQLETEINAAWDNRDAVNATTTGAVRDAVAAALALLDSGAARVAEPAGGAPWYDARSGPASDCKEACRTAAFACNRVAEQPA
mgnify:CR=1 FL=1